MRIEPTTNWFYSHTLCCCATTGLIINLSMIVNKIYIIVEKIKDPTPLNIFAIRVAAESRRCATNVSLLVDTLPGKEHAVIIRNGGKTL